MSTPAKRDLESSLRDDLEAPQTYHGYLGLDRILSAQEPRSQPEHHDEMLFIIQHQVSELWLKLIIHELTAAKEAIRTDHLNRCQKILARVKQVQRQLFEQWAVLETLTPSEYAEFRHVLGHASGFQSIQYRLVEFLLGNKHAGMLKFFRHEAELHARLKETLEAPSLYDEFILFLARHQHPVPRSLIERDFSEPHVRNDELVEVFRRIYSDRATHWREYALCEQLVDIEESFQLWRFRHMKTVERIIGHGGGTGGSSGVSFLRRALDLTFFPELIDVRTQIASGQLDPDS